MLFHGDTSSKLRERWRVYMAKLSALLRNTNTSVKGDAITATSLLKKLSGYSKEYSEKMKVAKGIWIPSQRNSEMMRAQSSFKSHLRDIKREMKNLPKDKAYWALVEAIKVASIKVASDDGWHLTPELVKKIRARPKNLY